MSDVKRGLICAGAILAALVLAAPARAQAPQVIGGDPPGALAPAAVSLSIDDTPDTTEGCTGTLWRPRIIITAAHCVSIGESQATVDPRVVSVWAPGVDQNGDPTAVKVNSIYVPQGWLTHSGDAAGDYDIAFLVTDQPVGTPLWSRMATVDEAVALARAGTRLDYVGYGITTPRNARPSAAPGTPLHVAEALDSSVGANPSTLDTRGDGAHSTCAGDSGGPWLGSIGGQMVLVGIEASGWGSPCDDPSSDGSSGATMTLPAAFPDLSAKALAEAGDSAPAAPTVCVTWRGDSPECAPGTAWSTQGCIAGAKAQLQQRTASGWKPVSGLSVRRNISGCGMRYRYEATLTGTAAAGPPATYRLYVPKQAFVRSPVQYTLTVQQS